MEELTRSVRLPTPRWLTLRFPSRDLEREFRDRFAAEAVPRFRGLILLVIGLWLAFGLLDHRVNSPDTLFEARVLRFGIVLPILLCVYGLSYASMQTFSRYWQLGLAIGFAAIAGAMVYYTARLSPALRPGSAAGISLVIVGGYTLVMMRFVYAVGVALVVTVAVGLVKVHYHGLGGMTTNSLENGMIWVYMANIIGVVACRELEMFRRTKFIQRTMLEHEQQRAEALLRNTLPRSVAERLKRGDRRVVDGFESVTVLFGDLVGFTELASRLPPRELVDLLNDLYVEFDDIAERCGLEKIKTVGDAYMVVGGAPLPRDDHARAVAEMAIEMLEVVRRRREAGDERLQIRIGVHSGPVVAGVIGNRKLTYDVWGDTVNIASRMQSHGVVGAIQVSAATRHLLGNEYVFTTRGRVELKGKGATETFILEGRAGEVRTEPLSSAG